LFGLDGVHQVVRRPLVQQLSESDRGVLAVNDLSIEVGGLDLRQEGQTLPAQPGEVLGKCHGCFTRVAARLRHGIVGGQVVPGQEGADANGKDFSLSVTQMAKAL
jgi:hypothetical protein